MLRQLHINSAVGVPGRVCVVRDRTAGTGEAKGTRIN